MDQKVNSAVAISLREDKVNKLEELKLGDKLAIDRTLFAADRSMLALL